MNYKNYLLQLSSGNIAPITLQRGSGYIDADTNIQALLNLIEDSNIAPRYRLYNVNEDDTIRSEIPLEDLLAGGNYTENYQNGQRCSLSLTFFNQSGKYMPTINTLWAGSKIRLDAGQEQQDGSIVWVQKGIFVITSAQPSYSADNRTVSISAGDKFADLEGGVGTLPATYEIPTGTRIAPLVKELLSIQRGNGSPIDSQDPYFHPSLVNKLTQAKISKGTGDTIGSLILELANHLSAEVFYNAQGRLCFYPLNVVSDDNDKPILFNYLTKKGELTDLNFSLDYASIINKIILIGATVNGGVVRGEAINNDPASPLCVQRIGSRVSVINDSTIKTELVAGENARYQLRKQLVLKSSVNLTIPYTPLFGVNNLVMITDNFYNLVKQCFLIQSVSFSLDYSSNMSMTVSNLANLPFITNYKQTEDIFDEEEAKIEIRYPVTVNITHGTHRGPDYITKKGINYIYILPDEGYRQPYYPSELSGLNITGATSTYGPGSGIITLANPTGPVNITGQCYNWWGVETSASHGTISGGSNTITVGGSLTFTLTSATGYYVPGNISVTNATYTYEINDMLDKTQATITISNPMGPVTISAACVLPYSVSVYGTVGASGIWPQSGIVVYDGKFPNLTPLDTIETSSTTVSVNIKTSYMTLLAVDIDSFAYSNLTGGVSYDSSIIIENEQYLIFRVTNNGSVDAEVNGIAAPTPYDIRIEGIVGGSGYWPTGGISVYKGNYIATSDTPLLGTIEEAGDIFTDEVITQYVSVEVLGDSLLTVVHIDDATLRSEARYADGYILVFEILGPNADITVAADAHVNHVDVRIAEWKDGCWPSTGVKVYDGDYRTGSPILRKTIMFSQDTVGIDITSGYISLVTDVYDMTQVADNYPVTLTPNNISNTITFEANGVKTISSTNRQGYYIYSVSGDGSLYVDLYGIYDITLTGVLVAGSSFATLDVWAGTVYGGYSIGSITTAGTEQRFFLESYSQNNLTVLAPTTVISLENKAMTPPGAVQVQESGVSIELGEPYITYAFNKTRPKSSITIGEKYDN